MNTIYAAIDSGKYTAAVSYPSKPVEPAILRKRVSELTADEIASVNEVTASYAKEKSAYTDARAAYYTAQVAGEELFRKDLEEYHGMTGHPKADKLWSKAWEHGHSSGFAEVATWYDDLVDLVL